MKKKTRKAKGPAQKTERQGMENRHDGSGSAKGRKGGKVTQLELGHDDSHLRIERAVAGHNKRKK